MEIKEITFRRKFNLGNYESMDIELTATIGPEDDVDEVYKALDKKTVQLRNSR
jgi:putative lipoic acid-binding regulatory protein